MSPKNYEKIFKLFEESESFLLTENLSYEEITDWAEYLLVIVSQQKEKNHKIDGISLATFANYAFWQGNFQASLKFNKTAIKLLNNHEEQLNIMINYKRALIYYFQFDAKNAQEKDLVIKTINTINKKINYETLSPTTDNRIKNNLLNHEIDFKLKEYTEYIPPTNDQISQPIMQMEKDLAFYQKAPRQWVTRHTSHIYFYEQKLH